MSLLQKMQALKVNKVKPKRVVRIIDGEMRDARNLNIVYCQPPVQGKRCPKCIGSTRLVYTSTDQVEVCWWCTDGRGTISANDMDNYFRRLRQDLEMCYVRTYIARLLPLILD